MFSRTLYGLAAATVALLFSAAPSVSAFADPGACSGACSSHDPAVIQRSSDGQYFRFETGGEIGIWKAPSLTGSWVYQGKVLPTGSSINLKGNTDCWAPDVHLIGDTYHLYYAVSTFGSQDSSIGVATSTTMEAGSWTDHGAIGVASKPGDTFNAIDPNLIQTSAGNFMTFGSFYGGIHQTQMDQPLQVGPHTPKQIAFNSTGAQALESAFVYEHDSFFYLFFSSGQCCGLDKSKPAAGEEYKIFVCRSSSVSGPYVDRAGTSCTSGNGGTLVLESHGTVYAAGGQGVLDDKTHGSVLYYHYLDTTVGIADANTRFGWNTIDWSTGWPVV